jgi:ankyrin repeat protein
MQARPSGTSQLHSSFIHLALPQKLEAVAEGLGDNAVLKLQQDHGLFHAALLSVAKMEDTKQVGSVPHEPPAPEAVAREPRQPDDEIQTHPVMNDEWDRLAYAQATQLWRAVFEGNSALVAKIAQKVMPFVFAVYPTPCSVLTEIYKGFPSLLQRCWLFDGRQEGILHQAARHNREQCVHLLLAVKTPPNLPDNEGRTALMIACGLGHKQSVRALLKGKASMKPRDQTGRSALCHCLVRTRRHMECMRMLIDAGIDVNAADENGLTTLHRAAQMNELLGATMLLDAMANANAQDNTGSTPLHYACAIGSMQMVQLLLVEGALVTIARSTDGAWPIHIAAMNGHEAVVVRSDKTHIYIYI